jgi:hypothetical protein
VYVVSKKFGAGDSTSSQRGWIMSWQALGLVSPLLISIAPPMPVGHNCGGPGAWTVSKSRLTNQIIWILTLIPAVGGLVAVGKMIVEFENKGGDI